MALNLTKFTETRIVSQHYFAREFLFIQQVERAVDSEPTTRAKQAKSYIASHSDEGLLLDRTQSVDATSGLAADASLAEIRVRRVTFANEPYWHRRRARIEGKVV